jgi:hypothetical protein
MAEAPAVAPAAPAAPVVEFTAEQQEHINKLFNARFAKINEKHEQEIKGLSDSIEALKKETKPAVAPVAPKTENTTDENVRQMQGFLAQEKENSRNLKGLLDAEKVAKDKVIEENKKILKDQAITEAAQTLPNGAEFHELKTVKKLVEDDISFDSDANQWVIKENGVTKMNSSLLPMSLTEYFAAFAASRPYLVKGNVKSGAGSTESGNSGRVNLGTSVVRTKADIKTIKDKVAYISSFGYDAWAKLPSK